MNIGRWKPVKVTPRELTDETFTRASVNSYTAECSNISVGLIAVNTAEGNLEYCFIGPPSQDAVNHCGMIPNVYLTRGILVTRNNFSNIQFLAILNEGFLVVINMSSNDSYITIDRDFCYSQHVCNLMIQTENMIYVGNQQKTMVLYKDTLRINATWNAGVRETLPVVENYVRQHSQHNIKMSPSLSTSTNTPISTMSNIKQTTSTRLTTTFTSLTVSTNLVTLSTDLASSHWINTSTNLIDTSTSLTASTGLINTPIDLTTSTSLISTFTVSSSSTSTQTGSPIMSSTLPKITSSPGIHYSTNYAHTDKKPETVTLLFAVIIVTLVLVIFLILFVVMTLLVIRYCKCGHDVVVNSNHLKMDHREVKLSQEAMQTKEPLQTAEGNKGEVVMISPETGMYSQTCTGTTTTTDSTIVSTTSNTTTKVVKTSGTTITEHKILIDN